jgi:hypothetical protein
LIREVAEKLGQKRVSETTGGGHSRKYVEREIRDDNNEVYLLISFLTVPDTNNLTLNSNLQKNLR